MARSDKRQRRRMDPEERRSSILRAAAVAFAEQPYPDVKMSTIAEAAEASEALVYRYYPTKSELSVEVVRRTINGLVARQTEALATLPTGTPTWAKLRVATVIYLDHIATHPMAWAVPMTAPSVEPPAAVSLRAEVRKEYVDRLHALLGPSEQHRRVYALWGYFGFLDAACLQWAASGCPDGDREALIDAALGALKGAL